MILTFWQLIGLVSTGAFIFYAGLRAGSFKQKRFAEAYRDYKIAVDKNIAELETKFAEVIAGVVIEKVMTEIKKEEKNK
jgi:uncharacterized membrane protein